MNVRELFELVDWVERTLGGKQPQRNVGPLHGALQNNTQPGAAKQELQGPLKQATDFLSAIDVAGLTLEQLSFLKRLDLDEYLGEKGADLVSYTIKENPIDPANAAKQIGEIVQKLTQGGTRAAQIKQALTGLVDPPPAPTGETLLRVIFTHDAAIKNVEDFKTWGAEWHDIGRGIAMAHNLTPQDVRVVGATSGSIVIELTLAYAIARTVGAILMEGAKVVDRYIDLRKRAEELRTMQLNNDKIALDLENEAEGQRKKGIQRIESEVIARIGELNGEQKTALNRSITKLLAFVEKGGELDIVPPALPAAQDGANAEGNADVADIRQLQEQIKQIRHEGTLRQLGLQPPAPPAGHA